MYGEREKMFPSMVQLLSLTSEKAGGIRWCDGGGYGGVEASRFGWRGNTCYRGERCGSISRHGCTAVSCDAMCYVRHTMQLRQPATGSFLLLGSEDPLLFEEWVCDILYVQQR